MSEQGMFNIIMAVAFSGIFGYLLYGMHQQDKKYKDL